MYQIEYTEDAEQDLQSFRKSERKYIVDEIDANLQYEPTVETRTVSIYGQMILPIGNCELENFASYMMWRKR